MTAVPWRPSPSPTPPVAIGYLPAVLPSLVVQTPPACTPPRMPAGLPNMESLGRAFPRAGLPARLVGTTVDNALWWREDAEPARVMRQLKAIGMNCVRLGAYWEEIQPGGPSGGDFTRLDAYLDAAHAEGLRVIMSVGAKAPNWPEFHHPAWAKPDGSKDVADDPVFRSRTLSFVKLAMAHLVDHPAICMWQAENEPLNPSGPEKRVVGEALLVKEIALIREADRRTRPIMINCWSAADQKGALEACFRLGDCVGLDIYTYIPQTWFSGQRTEDVPKYALELARKTGTPALVAELQADSWGDYQVKGGDVEKLTHKLVRFGYGDVIFWRHNQNLTYEAEGNTTLSESQARLAAELLGCVSSL